MKQYHHQEVEKRIYQTWEERKCFTPKIDSRKKPFVIILPPPNASGKMHLGNLFSVIIQDVLIRYHRMKGEPTLWLPGTDHGGYETEITFRQEFEDRGEDISRLTRKELYEKISFFVQENNKCIKQQLKAIGASVDWSRFRFTLDKRAVQCVYAAFKKFKQDGLVKLGKHEGNYCQECATQLSNIEVVDHDTLKGVKVCKAGHIVEKKPLPTWLVQVHTAHKSLKQPAIAAVKTGQITIVPSEEKEKYFNWMRQVRFWPIARQNVWGIRIPICYDVSDPSQFIVWFIDKSRRKQMGTLKELLERGFSWEEIEEGLERVQVAEGVKLEDIKYVLEGEEKKEGVRYLLETDTFDTWFSSTQWIMTALGYSDTDFTYFYPASIEVEGQDLLRKAVAREIMLAYYLTGGPPYSSVYLHPLVLGEDDNRARTKMSKSMRNAVYPEEYIEQFGADALRMALVYCTGYEDDFLFLEDKGIAEYRQFMSKLWHIGQRIGELIDDLAKRVGMGVPRDPQKIIDRLRDEDRKILSELKTVTIHVTNNLDRMQLADAQSEIVTFLRRWLTIDSVERVKKRHDKDVALSVLRYVYLTCVILLHPFIPFITEEIYGTLAKSKKPLAISDWPQAT